MHEMGGFDVQKAIEIFKIPENFEIGIMIAIGYQDKHSCIPERFRQKAYSPLLGGGESCQRLHLSKKLGKVYNKIRKLALKIEPT